MENNEMETIQTESVSQPEAVEAPAKKPASEKRSFAEIAIGVLAMLLIVAAIVVMVSGGLSDAPVDETLAATHPADGNPDDVTCKGTYTVTDAEAIAAAADVVAKLGDVELTSADLQIYYWMQVVSFLNENSYYLSYYGLDYTQPLDTQMCAIDSTKTWQQYFLECGLDAWSCYKVLAMEAKANGFADQNENYQEYVEKVEEEVAASAASYGYSSVEEMLENVVGSGSNAEAYFQYLEDYYLGYLYFNSLYEAQMPTDADIEAFYDEHLSDYIDAGIEKDDSVYVDVRHILVMPEGGTTDEEGKTTYSEEEWEAAREKAQGLLDQWLAGDATEASFGELAELNTSDPGSAENGGLYTYVAEGEMVPAFNDWCFDSARQTGDYGLVKTEYGYHVMYFVQSQSVWFVNAETDLLSEISEAIVPALMEKYEMSCDFSSMVLGNVDLS